MKKFILLILSIILISFLGVVVWMNLTPGYFQYGVCGYVRYYTNDEVEVMKNWVTRCRLPSGFEKLGAQILIRLARLDFNRAPLQSLPNSQGQNQLPVEGKFCGGIAANLPQFQCPAGYHCQLEDNHPDASGVCIK